ncbi:hypothetical protein GQX73_g1463 [Xylaria multiplex]|uniref:AMP-activated protein kinase glycogen-binding domain-containing protein n=1 Tax=Xylaria multiplex TaxID=323545 RepID=A0A7C8N3D4_9PEZI|nr:hypothetical protein GQX73_g1463 [Xylaria multiplex]
MPSRSQVPVTFTFHRRGVHPPLFVAGSFSKPPWQPHEMDASIDQHGDFIFTKQVMVDECSEIQYKFRHASGDWWALDPDADTVTDDQGNVNSLLYSPTIKAAQEITTLLQEVHATRSRDTAASRDPDIPNDTETPVLATDTQNMDTKTNTADPISSKEAVEKDELRRLSFTPIEEVANTAAEVADSASHLDEDEFEFESDDMPSMFSHECFASPSYYHEPEPQHDGLDQSSESADLFNTNFDDPQLEHFPSDRHSIIATMRRLSTTIDADPTMVDTALLPPIIAGKASDASNPPQSQGPFGINNINTTYEQMKDIGQQPRSIATRNSLQSIEERDESPCGHEWQDRSTPAEYIGPIEKRNLSLASSGSSNEDEGVYMSPIPRRNISKATNIKAVDNNAQPTAVLDEVTAEAATTNTPPIEERPSMISNSSKSSEQNDESDLQKPINGERPHSPSSTCSIRDSRKGNWLGTFLRTVFVDWIGDLFSWLCSRSRNQV